MLGIKKQQIFSGNIDTNTCLYCGRMIAHYDEIVEHVRDT